MTIKERRLNPVTLQFRLQSWFGVKKHSQAATLNQLSVNGATITTPFKLKIGQLIQLSMNSHCHTIKRLPAEIVSVENKGVDYQYSIHFRLTEFSETAVDNVQTVLQQLERSFQQITE